MKISMLAAACVLSLFTCAHAAELKVEVLGVEKAEGQVMVALYDEGQFLKKALKGLRLPAAVTGVSGSFSDLPEGNYAVIAFHDENGNGKLDFNAVGMPIERMGFSNDAVGVMGPPGFSAARFEVNAATNSIVINLR